MEFPLTLNDQAQLDDLIKGRLERERSKFSDYDDLKKQVSDFTATEAGLKAQVEAAVQRATQAEATIAEANQKSQLSTWRTAAATEAGVPEAALRGSTEEELKAHAAELKTLLDTTRGTGTPVPTAGQQPAQTPPDPVAAFTEQLFGSITS